MKKFDFRHYLIFSIIAHIVLVIIIFTFDGNLFSRKKFHTSAVKVDVVKLPDITPVKKKRRIKEKKAVIKKTIPKKEKLKNKKKKDAMKKKESKEPDSDTKNEEIKYEGNQLSEGNSIEGNEESNKMANIYVTEITGIIKLHWRIPRYMKDQNLVAELEIKIDKEGRLVTKKIIKSSQNLMFDNKVLNAIQNATPFPKPPENAWKLIKDGIVFVLNSNESN